MTNVYILIGSHLSSVDTIFMVLGDEELATDVAAAFVAGYAPKGLDHAGNPYVLRPATIDKWSPPNTIKAWTTSVSGLRIEKWLVK